MGEIGALVAIIDLITGTIGFLVSVATYVLTALGLYTIAKRRGIEKPWLVWIPVVNVWTLGCISDQYRYVVKGENKSKRKVLLGLEIAMAVCMIVFMVLIVISVVDIVGMTMGSSMDEQAMLMSMLGSLGGAFLMFIPIFGISIAYTIIYYMVLYDVYTSCDPNNNVTFLVLSILFSITMPFFIFFNRKKDLGMPPRRPEPMQYMPQQGAYQQAQPNWQQPQQSVEPDSGNPENF